MTINLHIKFFFTCYFSLFAFSLLPSYVFSQPDLPNPPSNLEMVNAGSWVIPMDIAHQSLVAPFNLKAYGLIHALLLQDIPVKWVIKSGKLKDGIDFTANTERIFPTSIAASNEDFRASAFIIDTAYINTPAHSWSQSATQVLNNYYAKGSRFSLVTVYKLTSNETVDVRYTLNQRPKIAVFSNGGNQQIHFGILDSAGVTNYVVISAGVFTGLAECYTFCSEAHWAADAADTAIMSKVSDFVYSGGNFLAQCHAIQVNTDGYEANMLFHTTAGLTEIGIATATNSYYNTDLAMMQFDGLMQANEGGSGKNWRLKAGSSWRSGTYRAVSTENATDTVVAFGAKLTLPADTVGGNVYYLGGHNYLEVGADWTDIEQINAGRLYLNATLVPAARPTVFVPDIGTNQTMCLGQSVTLGGSPTGPPGSTYTWFPATGLDNPSSPNPVASPTTTTTYTLFVDNNGCPGEGAVTVTVNNAPTSNAGTDKVVCANNNATSVSGSVSNATGGIWSSTGSGTFSPSDTSLNTTYIPSDADTTSGSIFLILNSTGSGTCASSDDTLLLTITDAPTANANVNQTVCANNPNVPLNGSVTVATGGTWTSSGGGTFSPNANTLNATYIPDAADTGNGTVTLTLTTTGNGTCNAVSDAMLVTITDAPIVNAGADIGVCSSLLNANLNGSVTIATGGSWTTSGTGTFSPDANTLNATYNPTQNDINAGTIYLTITTTGNGTCSPVSDTAALIITPDSIAVNAGNDSTICAPGVSLNGSAYIATGGVWTTLGSGTFSPDDSLLNTEYFFSNTDTSNGLVQLILTTTGNGACAPKSDTVEISILDFITTTSTAADTFCAGINSLPVSANPSTGEGFWTTLGNGTFSPDTITLNSFYQPSANEINAGITTLVFTTTNNGTCAARRDTLQIVLLPAPIPDIVETDVSCFGGNDGTATASATGGASPYSYLWSNGDSTPSLSGLSSSVYSVTITDIQNCTSDTSILVDEPDSALSAITTFTNITCVGGNDGTAAVVSEGGTSPYSYLWNDGMQTGSRSSLPVGNYAVTITDINNCTTTGSGTVNESLTPLVLDTSSTNVSCNGGNDGTATVAANGGTSPYSYLWNDSQITATATGLFAGTYYVTITDTNNCVMDTVVIVNEPISPLSMSISTDSVNCFGGSDGTAEVITTGGTPPYTYEWSNGDSTSVVSGIPSAVYSVTVTDNTQNCKVGNSIAVNQPDSIVLNTTYSNVNCFGGDDGAASVAAAGGTSPYSYLWSTGSADNALSAIGAGTYSVTITDNNNCTDSIAINITEPATALGISSIASTNVNCNGGSDGTAAVAAAGGTSPYFYEWSTGDSVSSVSGLPASDYFVTITDTNDCTTDTSVTITEPFPGLTASTNVTNVSCFGGNDGTATVTPAGGTSPYFYQWSSNANSQTDSTATGLIAGVYSVAITDNNGCILSSGDSVVVNEPTTYVSVLISTDSVSCFGGSDGSASLIASGGTLPYSYLWSTGDTTALASGISANTYSATITDNNNCATSPANVTIYEPLPITLMISQTNLKCKGDSDGSASLTINGGTPPYSYLWNDGVQTKNIASLQAGTYFATVTDTNNCAIDTFVNIIEPDSFFLLATSYTGTLCFGDSNGTATVIPSGGNTPYVYQWALNANAQTAPTATGLKKGNYSVTVTDGNGCIDSSKIVTVPEPTKLVATASPNDTICLGDSAAASATGNGGTTPYAYLWSDGDTTQSQTVFDTSNTTYFVTITDKNGCSSADTVNIYVRKFEPDSLILFCGTDVFGCTICPGDSVIISATYPEQFPGTYNYLWVGIGPGTGFNHQLTVSPESTKEYIFKVTDKCAKPIQDTLTIVVDTFPKISVNPIYADDCVPLEVAFANAAQNPPGSTYLWKFGDGNTSADSMPKNTYSQAGTYSVSLTIISPPPSRCIKMDDTATTVIVRPLPQPNCLASPAVATLQNPVINYATENFKTYFWDFDDGDSSTAQSPVHTYKDSGDYTVTLLVTNEYNCENTCEVTIRINPFYPPGIPNAFTPDPNGPNGGTYSFNDFTNNVFFPITRYVTDYHMEIFNRWGELIYESFDINKGWDGYYLGELCQQDVYVWKIYIKWWDDNTFNDVGDVTLLR